MDGKSMFGDIKSKLGFGRKNDYEEFYEDYEEFEEGDDYGEYGYDESYERTSGSAYDPYDSVTTRPASVPVAAPPCPVSSPSTTCAPARRSPRCPTTMRPRAAAAPPARSARWSIPRCRRR